jgi:AmmeMemoRadiSam system protein B
MIRPPAVAGQFYPDNPKELAALVSQYTREPNQHEKIHAKACLVPHAGYVYSGHVAGAVFSRIVLPKRIIILGVRHYPRGEPLAILSAGKWRTPLGDARIDEDLAKRVCAACPALREDEVAHRREHSLEVELPFLQALDPHFTFVPIAVGTIRFQELVKVGEGLARVLAESGEDAIVFSDGDDFASNLELAPAAAPSGPRPGTSLGPSRRSASTRALIRRISRTSASDSPPAG